MSLDAYRQRQAAAEAPRETEYRLMGQVTGALINARERALTGGELMKVLDWNRRMWSTFAADCSVDGNRLPKETRAGIISLSIYVGKTTREVMRGKAQIDDLVEINRIIMKGLEPMQQAQAPDADASSSPVPFGGLVG